MNTSQKKLAVVATVVGLALASQQLPTNRSLLGQVQNIPVNEFSAEQVAAGVTLPADAHNFFTCQGGAEVSVDANDLGSARAWAYEFTGDEPPFTGDFWISPAELDANPQYGSINTLRSFKEGRRYYIMSEKDLYAKCGEGVSLAAVCGNGIIEEGEECDDGNTDGNDECSAVCTNPVVYIKQKFIGNGGTFPPTSPVDVPLLQFSIWSEGGKVDVAHTKFEVSQGSLEYAVSNSDTEGITIWLDNDTSDDDDAPNVKWFGGRIENDRSVIFTSQNGGNDLFITLNDGVERHFEVRAPSVSALGIGTFQLKFAGQDFAPSTTQDRSNTVEVELSQADSPAWITPAVCGNGRVETGEECDDGNTENGDGCDVCKVGQFQQCSGEPSICGPLLPTLPGQGPGSHTECVDSQCRPVDGPGEDECSNTSDCVDNTERFVTLHDAYIQGDDLVVTYSKNVEACAELFKDNGPRMFPQIDFMCPSGTERIERAPLNQLSGLITSRRRRIKICADSICSDPVAIRRVAPPTGSLFITKDDTPLRYRQLLGGEALGEAVLRLELHAEGEDIQVSQMSFINTSNSDSIDKLELHLPGAGRIATATKEACNGVGGDNLFCANMTPQFIVNENGAFEIVRPLVVPAGEDIDVLVRPIIKSDVQGGVSNETVQIELYTTIEANGLTSGGELSRNDGNSTAEGEIFIGTDVPGANGTYPSGEANKTVHAKIVSITNANPDSNGTSVPTGISAIGQFKFSAAAHNNSKNGDNDAILDNIIFDVNGTNVAISARSFALYNKSDQTKIILCAPHYLSGELFTAPNISGTFYVQCTGIKDSVIDSELDEGTDETFVLEADILNPNVAAGAGGVSVLQVSLQDFDRMDNTGFGIGQNKSHIEWIDKDQVTNTILDWVEYPETTVKSTSYSS